MSNQTKKITNSDEMSEDEDIKRCVEEIDRIIDEHADNQESVRVIAGALCKVLPDLEMLPEMTPEEWSAYRARRNS